jgi:nicotinic acid mononucleotide adenylyltransferase
MIRLAVGDTPFFAAGLCTHGLFLDICAGIRRVYPQKPELFFIAGRDAAERSIAWPYANPAQALEQMFSTFQLLVCEREGEFAFAGHPLVRAYTDRIHPLKPPENLDHISSTRVRRRLSAGLPVRQLVPVAVEHYIREHNLYTNPAGECEVSP